MTVAAVQHVLAGEHAAVWAYGVLGAHLPRSRQPRVLAALDRHRALRDALIARVRAAGAVPVAAEPAYAVPFAVTATGAPRLAAQVEDRLAGLYVALVEASAEPDLRRLGAAAAQECAVRAVQWGAALQAFPGR
jgi:ABC-type amino acid transport substrate-binding protein